MTITTALREELANEGVTMDRFKELVVRLIEVAPRNGSS